MYDSSFVLLTLKGVPFFITADAEIQVNTGINSRWVVTPPSLSAGRLGIDGVDNLGNDLDDFSISFTVNHDITHQLTNNTQPNQLYIKNNIARSLGWTLFKNMIRFNDMINYPKALKLCSVVSKWVTEPACLIKSVAQTSEGLDKSRVTIYFYKIVLIQNPSASSVASRSDKFVAR